VILRAGLIVAAAAAAMAVFSGSIVKPVAAQAPKNVWDGAYTAEQAVRGKQLYVDSCSNCHKEGLQGSDLAPALKGDDFLLQWADSSMKDVFDTISTKMPQDNPGSLMPQVNADILAFILQVNKFPAGHDELKPDATLLKGITITPTKP
jgi:mono/diheme cytochrome c family protein